MLEILVLTSKKVHEGIEHYDYTFLNKIFQEGIEPDNYIFQKRFVTKQ